MGVQVIGLEVQASEDIGHSDGLAMGHVQGVGSHRRYERLTVHNMGVIEIVLF